VRRRLRGMRRRCRWRSCRWLRRHWRWLRLLLQGLLREHGCCAMMLQYGCHPVLSTHTRRRRPVGRILLVDCRHRLHPRAYLVCPPRRRRRAAAATDDGSDRRSQSSQLRTWIRPKNGVSPDLGLARIELSGRFKSVQRAPQVIPARTTRGNLISSRRGRRARPRPRACARARRGRARPGRERLQAPT
jgi:hypothetical protein